MLQVGYIKQKRFFSGCVLTLCLRCFDVILTIFVSAAPVVTIDPWDMFDPVEILSQLPKNFFEQVVGISFFL